MRTHFRRRLAGLGSALLLATTSGCSTAPAPAPTRAADPDLPPVEATDLRAIYGDALDALGLVLTPRGGLIDRTGGGYRRSPTGTHLALYVEPARDYDDDQYVQGILDVTRIFAPDVFDRWTGLGSFDVCQEPPAEVDDREEPTPATQIELTRAQSAAIDWGTVTVSDLVSGSRAQPPTLRLVVSEELTRSRAWGRLTP